MAPGQTLVDDYSNLIFQQKKERRPIPVSYEEKKTPPCVFFSRPLFLPNIFFSVSSFPPLFPDTFLTFVLPMIFFCWRERGSNRGTLVYVALATKKKRGGEIEGENIIYVWISYSARAVKLPLE